MGRKTHRTANAPKARRMSVKSLNLAELQARLFRLITARGSVAEELAVLGLPPAHIDDCIAGDDKLDAVGRLDIYNGMYFLRLLEDVLQADYPTVLALLGEARFAALVSDYLQACKPCHPSVREASSRLPGFLESWSTTNNAPAWLSQLAALEWARVDVFDEIDEAVLTMPGLAERDPTTLPEVQLRAITAHRCLFTTHHLAPLWRAVDQGETPPQPEAITQILLVWRQDGVVYHRTANEDERAFLPQLAAGFSFGQLCEQLGEQLEEAQAAHTAVKLLARWAQDGLLTAAQDAAGPTR